MAAVGWATCQAQEIDPTLMRRFQEDAQPSWIAYARRAATWQGTLTFDMSQRYLHLHTRHTSEFIANEHASRIMVSSEKTADGTTPQQARTLMACNPKYAFVLNRKTSDSPWLVTELVNASDKDQHDSVEQRFYGDYRTDVQLLVWLYREPLAEIVHKPYFRVLRCRALPLNGEELVEISFDYAHNVERRSTNPVQGGTMILDPKRAWCLRAFDVQTRSEGSHGTMKFKLLEFGQSDENFPPPKDALRETAVSFDDGMRNEQTWHFAYELSVPRRLPADSEFTLTTFGLPEPPGAAWPSHSPRMYVWVGLVGIACLLSAVILRAVLWRRRGAASVRA